MQFEALMPFVTLDGGRIKRKTNNEDTLVFIVNIENSILFTTCVNHFSFISGHCQKKIFYR